MSKMWGGKEFWGLGPEYDPDWMLTEAQKKLRDDLIELCRKEIRPRATVCDKNYKFPRESMDALAKLGILGLIVPKEFGGLGENQLCMNMVVETIARYGCPSTAMVYIMHITAVAAMLFRHHGSEEIQNLLKHLDKDKMIGTIAFSDPATGGHFWFFIASKAKLIGADSIQLLKYNSWCTSAGHADWYLVGFNSPDFGGDFSNYSIILIYRDEIRASNDEWEALGLHGNMSGSLVVEGIFSTKRIVGKLGDGKVISDEIPPLFLLTAGSCWNGVAMASMDIARKHVTRKALADVGMRVCDFPAIQNYFGECIAKTNALRLTCFTLAQYFDSITNNCDWLLHKDPTYMPRAPNVLWVWQNKYLACKNVYHVTDKMLQACGGTGYKTDLGIERLLRDGRAGWVMAPSNEVLENMLGKVALCGVASLDIWEQRPNERVIHHELTKMSLEKKKALAMDLLKEVEGNEEGKSSKHPFQDTDFENPFNTCPPAVAGKILKTADGIVHETALHPESWKPLPLESYTPISETMGSFRFSLPRPTDHTGCTPGQYVRVKINTEGKDHFRYFSPVSPPDDFGRIELVMKFETQGIVSKYFQALEPGNEVEFQGPCGGFEYEPNKLDVLTLLASGGGITPGLQLIRCIMKNPEDKTKVKLLYYSDDLEDILYKEELDQYAAEDQRLEIVYSVGVAPEDWEGEEGFISTEMIEKYVAKPNHLKHKIVVCGGSTMAISCLYSLCSLDFPSHSIFIYGQFGTEFVRSVFGKNAKLSGHTCN